MKIDDLDDYELFVLIMAGAEDIGNCMTSDMPLVEIGAETKKIVDRLSEFVTAYQARVATGATVHKMRPRMVTDKIQ